VRALLALLACALGLRAATGKVAYTGTLISFGTIQSGAVASNVFDGDLTTNWFVTNVSGGYVGWDFGAAVTITEVRTAYAIAPWAPDTVGLSGSTIDTSPDNSTWTTRFTYPLHPMVPRYRFQANAITVPSARYYRFLSAWHGSVAELEFVGNAGEAASGSRPVEPVITSGAGVFPGGSAVIGMSSLTTSAAMRYTIDGSAPTCASTLYSAPFTLTVGVATQVKAVACDASLTVTASLVTTSGVFRNYQIKPGDTWYDTAGRIGNFNDGEVKKFNGVYYKYGSWAEKGNGCVTLVSTYEDLCSNDGTVIYKSTDLLNWNYANIVTTPSSWSFQIRAHVLFNASTSKYVLWAESYNIPSGVANRASVFTSDTPDGVGGTGWTLVTQTLNPDGFGYFDSNLFLDHDGVTAYVIYAGGAGNFYISKLSSDYLSTVNGSTGACGATCLVVNAGAGREGMLLFWRLGTYFIVSSVSNYYNSALTFDVEYQTNTGTSPLSTSPAWSGLTAFYASDPVGTVDNGQPTSVLNLGGDNWLYQSDHWNNTDLQSSTRVWYMLNFPTSTSVAPPSPLPTSWNLPSLTAPASTVSGLATIQGGTVR
jgi:chitobiase/beta-hexosaminidase-like protein